MSRPLRIQYPGAVYHVMNRGNARQPIFQQPGHYPLFLRCLKETVEMWKIKVHAFTLLPNHYHLLIETPLGNLSRAMRHLNHIYTQRFNRLAGRDGHLFRGRYKSILVEEDAYLVELVRYIHMNPVKAGLAKMPQKHEWTSHHSYLTGGGVEFLTTQRILNYFGKRKNLARRKFHEFVTAGVPQTFEDRLSSPRWPSVLSSENFEDWVRWNFVKDLDNEELEYVPEHVNSISENVLKRLLCQILDIQWPAVLHPVGRKEQQDRARTIWFYRQYLKKGYGALSKQFGLTPSRISGIMKSKNLIHPQTHEEVAAYVKSEN